MSIITTGPSGGAPNRLEINDFVKHDKFFSLYIQALHLLQTRGTQDDPSSFFQISGIHGLPYTNWDGVPGQVPSEGGEDGDSGGYCTHGNVLFPTWHRPYVALYEQMIQKYAKEVAATYTVDCAAWIQAAEELRQPYWDWAAKSVPPDEVVALSKVSITGPDGRKVTVDNPIYSYTFHPIDPSFRGEFLNYKSTVRYPQEANPVATLKKILAGRQNAYTTDTYNMLTRIHDWQSFSNHTANNGDSTVNSLEAIHDKIHGGAGGTGGHMADVIMASFDPLFYLHHCNVDRMLSLWSALNPTVWVSPGSSEGGTWTIPPHTQVDETTPLTPFRNAPGKFWASAGIHDTAKLGYTYPEFNHLDMNNPSAVSKAIGDIINKLYGDAVFGSLPSPVPPQHSPAPAPPVHGPAHRAPVPRPSEFYDWTARIEFKKFEVGQSFNVYLFLGVPPQDPKDWDLCHNLAGTHFAFVNSQPQRCANCVVQADIVVEGFVHLNYALAKLSRLGSLDPTVVEPYLTKELHWRAMKVDGEPIDLRSLEVSVYATPMSYPTGAMFPVPGRRRHCRGVTHGRPGGCRRA